MFNELVESVGSKKKTDKGWAVVLSGLVQSVSLIVLILIPLIHIEALPKAVFSTVLIAPAPPPPSAPPPDQSIRERAEQPTRLFDHNILHAPNKIPTRVAIIIEEPLPPESPAAAIASGPLGGGDLFHDFGAPSPPAAPPSPPPSRVPPRIQLGGQIQVAKIISQPSPIYPPLARQARIQGSVLLHAVLDKDGRVSELQVISGHPLLVQAALDAVKQWRYRPTLLNNEPVEVDTTITVTFVLGG